MLSLLAHVNDLHFTDTLTFSPAIVVTLRTTYLCTDCYSTTFFSRVLFTIFSLHTVEAVKVTAEHQYPMSTHTPRLQPYNDDVKLYHKVTSV